MCASCLGAGVAAQVGDKPPVRSKVVACKAASRASLNPTFNQELWLPVTFPAMTSKVNSKTGLAPSPKHTTHANLYLFPFYFHTQSIKPCRFVLMFLNSCGPWEASNSLRAPNSLTPCYSWPAQSAAAAVFFVYCFQKIKHGVWDHDWGPDPDDLVCEFTTDLKVLHKFLDGGRHKRMGPFWVNLYGASVCDDPNAMANALAGFVGQSDSGNQVQDPPPPPPPSPSCMACGTKLRSYMCIGCRPVYPFLFSP